MRYLLVVLLLVCSFGWGEEKLSFEGEEVTSFSVGTDIIVSNEEPVFAVQIQADYWNYEYRITLEEFKNLGRDEFVNIASVISLFSAMGVSEDLTEICDKYIPERFKFKMEGK